MDNESLKSLQEEYHVDPQVSKSVGGLYQQVYLLREDEGEATSSIGYTTTPDKTDHQSINTSSNADGQKKIKGRHTTHYNSWHYTDMILAIKAVQNKLLSMTAAAKKYGIPRTTLRHYLNDGTNKEAKRLGFFLPKEHENRLLEYVLKHSDLPEKQLYKYIFEKAKELCDSACQGGCDEDRRLVPTPAWIRRFVYRQKKLHMLFPTLLSKFEHPLHGGRKSTSSNESTALDTRGRSLYDRASMVENESGQNTLSFENDSDNQSPKTECFEQSFNSVKSRSLSEGYISSKSPSPSKMQYLFPSASAPPMMIHTAFNRYERNHETFQYSMVRKSNDDFSSENTKKPRVAYPPAKKDNYTEAKHFQRMPWDSSTMAGHDSAYFFQHCDNIDSSNPHSSSTARAHSDNSFELHVAKQTLSSMEHELGHDYVSLFKERFARNRALERFYCKWVSLKTDIERMEKDCFHESVSRY